MRANGIIRARNPAGAGRLARELQRAFLACSVVVALCVVAVVIASWSQASVSPGSRSRTSGEIDLSTGAMLVVTPTGKLCRERTIDNSTWRIRNKGWVDCDEALAKSANSGADVRSPGSRLDIIREGFLGRQ